MLHEPHLKRSGGPPRPPKPAESTSSVSTSDESGRETSNGNCNTSNGNTSCNSSSSSKENVTTKEAEATSCEDELLKLSATGSGGRASDEDGNETTSSMLRAPVFVLRSFQQFISSFSHILTRLPGIAPLFSKKCPKVDAYQFKLFAVACVMLLALRLRRSRQASAGPLAQSGVPGEQVSSTSSTSPRTSSRMPLMPIGSLFGWCAPRRRSKAQNEISFSQVLQLVAANAVEEVQYCSGSRLLLLLKDKRKLTSHLVPGAEAAFFRAVAAQVPRFQSVRTATVSDVLSFSFPIFFLIVWFCLLRSLIKPLKGGKDTGTDRGLEACPPAASFADVICKQKHELQEIVLLLNGEGLYTAMGARLPRGVLLVGPAGTGKTLLARAVAGEASVGFLSVAASEFVDTFVGQGARRVREVFQAARKRAPCVLFVDELDALGSRVGPVGLSSGHEEYVQTINQFLMEMDGVTGGAGGVVVVGATNRLDAIDEALLRSGRFDRHIYLDLPSLEERHEILKLHAKRKRMQLGIDAWSHLQAIAEAAEGLSGADLENLLNESIFRAVRRGGDAVDRQALDEALLTLLQRKHTQARTQTMTQRGLCL